MRWSHRLLLALGILFALSPAASAASTAMEYRYWDWGKTKKRDDYQVLVLQLALDKTREEYGPYRIVRVVESFSTLRLRRVVSEGSHINIHAAPWRVQDPNNQHDRAIAINTPIMGGLLGYRKLLIRRADLEKFRQIQSAGQLKKLVAGQGRAWVDVPVYRHNGYAVDDSANLPNLVSMLLNRRFDYLPMSVIEVDSVLAQHAALARDLAVAPGILIQYPLPAVFYVSAKAPVLAERLARGLAMAKKDGSLDDLLQRYFRKEFNLLQTDTTREFVLVNPDIPAALVVPVTSFRR